ncbi:hypothetical protein [Streptomyces atratus]|uniref:hypothetical protein n=1 Tax=Streptomyces atratus TaxID=1893 RepID=UPI0033E7603C
MRTSPHVSRARRAVEHMTRSGTQPPSYSHLPAGFDLAARAATVAGRVTPGARPPRPRVIEAGPRHLNAAN